MSKQVLSVEQMQHLQELGLDISNASSCYYKQEGWEEGYFIALACDIKEKGGLVYYYDSFSGKEYILNEVIPAYSLQEVLDALPKMIYPFPVHKIGFELWIGGGKIFYANMFNLGDVLKARYDKELIDAAYELLVWCIENKYVETNKKDES